MANIWDGNHLWIWQANQVCGGDPAAIAAQAKSLGIDGVLIKFADGSLARDPVSQAFMADFKRLVGPLKEAGLIVGGWIYQYLTDVAGEVEACAEAIAAGADWIVLDGEGEVQGKAVQVQQFGQLLRAQHPNVSLGLSSFAISNFHAQVPFDAYKKFVDVMMPQVYWATMGWDAAVAFTASIASYKGYEKPIAPTGQAYDVATAADIARFVALCKTEGLNGINWWSWQHASSGQLAAVRDNRLPKPAVAVPQPPTPPTVSNAPPGVASDVPDDAWYKSAVQWAIDAGVMTKDDNGNFRPTDQATRAELAQVAFNVFHQKREG